MIKFMLSEHVKKMDEDAMSIGVSGLTLMENAGFSLFTFLKTKFQNLQEKKVIIFAGKGNNGGDGFVLARLLYCHNIDVKVIALEGFNNAVKSDAMENYNAALACNVPVFNADELDFNQIKHAIKKADIIVDCIFGTGLKRPVEGMLDIVITTINNANKYILCCDIPSGLHADSGDVLGNAIKADDTVTFEVMKPCHLSIYCGSVHVYSICVPKHIIDALPVYFYILEDNDISKLLPNRKPDGNKGTFGIVYTLCGSDLMPGALVLSSLAAYKTGCGLVYACSTKNALKSLQTAIPEVITYPIAKYSNINENSVENLTIDKKGVVVIGCGLGDTQDTADFVYKAISVYNNSFVIDADAINAVSKNVNILNLLKHLSVITPHPKEMSRLTGLDVSYILANMLDVAIDFSKKYNIVVALKGKNTVIASPWGEAFVNTTGNNCLSKGGTGDVLSGIIGSFIAQGLTPFNAAKLGVYIHGKAGDLLKDDLSSYGVLASDVCHEIPHVLRMYEGR